MQRPTGTPDPILNPALKVGAVTGAAGMVLGGANAILRNSPTMGLFSVLTGVNCALLGSTYWAARATIIRALQDPEISPLYAHERVYVSGAAGALAGSFVALVLKKPRNAIPGAIVWGLVGLAGQSTYNFADSRHTRSVIRKEERERMGGMSFWNRAMRSRWSPVTRLTTEEYEKILQEKLLALEADLAIANGEICRLEKLKQKRTEQEL